MEPQSNSPGRPAVPGHRQMSEQEILELGILALDEPNQAPGIPVDNPPLASPQPTTQPSPRIAEPPSAPDTVTPAPSEPMASEPAFPTAAAPATPTMASPPSPTVVAPSAAASVEPVPTAVTEPSAEQQFIIAPAQQQGPVIGGQLPIPPKKLQVAPIEQMGMSANSQKLHSIAKIRTLNIFLNALICLLAVAILVGGWLTYRYMMRSF